MIAFVLRTMMLTLRLTMFIPAALFMLSIAAAIMFFEAEGTKALILHGYSPASMFLLSLACGCGYLCFIIWSVGVFVNPTSAPQEATEV